jgi:predicted nucleic acid-binding Zn ribbon protein
MRRQKTQKLSDVIKMFKSQYNLNRDLDKLRVKKAWPEVVGLNAAHYTDKLYFRGSVLYVYLNSPVLRYELSGQRKLLQQRLNEVVGHELVSNVVLK